MQVPVDPAGLGRAKQAISVPTGTAHNNESRPSHKGQKGIHMKKTLIGKPQDLLRLIGLQFFAEGGSAGGDGGTGASPDAAAADVSDAGQGENVPEGTQAAETTPAEDQPAEETETRAQRYERFRKEFEAELKRDSDASTKKIVERRLKSHKALADKVAEHYGLASNDYEAMMNALEGDKDALRERAATNGRTEEDQRTIERLEAKERQRELEAEENRKVDAYQRIINQANECRAKYPDFSLEALEADTRGRGLLASGLLSVTEVYEMIHRDELDAQTAQTASAKTAEKVMGTVRQNRARPSEGGMSAGAAPATQITSDMLTPDVMSQIDRFVHIHGSCSEADMLAIINAARRGR